jgi:hypothetical protein
MDLEPGACAGRSGPSPRQMRIRIGCEMSRRFPRQGFPRREFRRVPGRRFRGIGASDSPDPRDVDALGRIPQTLDRQGACCE